MKKVIHWNNGAIAFSQRWMIGSEGKIRCYNLIIREFVKPDQTAYAGFRMITPARPAEVIASRVGEGDTLFYDGGTFRPLTQPIYSSYRGAIRYWAEFRVNGRLFRRRIMAVDGIVAVHVTRAFILSPG